MDPVDSVICIYSVKKNTILNKDILCGQKTVSEYIIVK